MKKSNFEYSEYGYALDLAGDMTVVSAAKASAGAQEVIAAPAAGQKLALAAVKLQRTAGTTAETVCVLKAGTTAFDHAVLNGDTPGVILFDAVTPLQLRILPAATAFNLDLSAANSVQIVVRYLVLEAN